MSFEKFSDTPGGSDNAITRRHLLKLAAAIPLCLGLPLSVPVAFAANTVNADLEAQWGSAPLNGHNLGWIIVGPIGGDSESPNGWKVDEGPLEDGTVLDRGRYITVTRIGQTGGAGFYTLYYNSGVFDHDQNEWVFLSADFHVSASDMHIQSA